VLCSAPQLLRHPRCANAFFRRFRALHENGRERRRRGSKTASQTLPQCASRRQSAAGIEMNSYFAFATQGEQNTTQDNNNNNNDRRA
jgi:hypothetical protein